MCYDIFCLCVGFWLGGLVMILLSGFGRSMSKILYEIM